MELGLYRREHLESGDTHLLGSATVTQFQRTHGAINAWAEVEHNSETGRHTTITAQALTVTGNAVISGALTVGRIVSPVNIGSVTQPVDLAGPVLGPDTVTDVSFPPSVGITADVSRPALTTDRDFLPSQDDLLQLGYIGAGPLNRRWRNVIASRTLYAPNVWATDRIWEKTNRTAALGYWTSPAFSAANYSADPPLTWTVAAGNQFRYALTLIGKTAIFAVITSGGVVGGGPTGGGLQLRVTIPQGLLPAGNAVMVGTGATGGSFTFVQVQAVAGRSYVSLQALSGAALWALGPVDAFFTIQFEVQ
jgi:hypothetical protein